MSGMKYQDIADKYDVSINTVKSWKKRYSWERKKGAHKNEKGCTQNDANKIDNIEPVVDEVIEVLENSELTETQQLFCIYFIKSFNATKAYQKAYKCNYQTAAVNGSRMLRNAKVKEMINQLKQEKLNREFLTEADIFQKYMDIAFADIGDYLQFGQEKIPVWKEEGGTQIPVIDPNTKKQKVLVFNTVKFNESDDVDTSIISEVSEGKNGIKLKLADRMAALKWLSEHMDMASSGQKEEFEKKKDSMQMIVNQLKAINDDDI